MSTILIIAVDLLVAAVMILGVYFRRHRRRDMVLAYLALNVGVLAVTLVLAGASLAAGLGLGLFGVLSIIRLRSSQLTQEEVAYYFASLALGLVAGLRPDPVWVAPLVSIAILGVMYAADHPRLHAAYRQQVVTVDQALTDELVLRERLEALLGARVERLVVTETDLVRDLTVVDVRYRLLPAVVDETGQQPVRIPRRRSSAPGRLAALRRQA